MQGASSCISTIDRQITYAEAVQAFIYRYVRRSEQVVIERLRSNTMALSIGVEYNLENWQTCLMEHGRTLELCSFVDSASALVYLKHICALYPEPTITLSVGYDLPLTRLNQLTEQQRQAMCHLPQRNEMQEILLAINSFSLDSYYLPAIRYLSSVPMHRKLKYENMGTPGSLCIVATLLYRMRKREMAWSEMQFFYVELGHGRKGVIVIENGRIVNGL